MTRAAGSAPGGSLAGCSWLPSTLVRDNSRALVLTARGLGFTTAANSFRRLGMRLGDSSKIGTGLGLSRRRNVEHGEKLGRDSYVERRGVRVGLELLCSLFNSSPIRGSASGSRTLRGSRARRRSPPPPCTLLAPSRHFRYALNAYCCTMRCVLKNEALKAIAPRMTPSHVSRSL